MYCIHWSKPAFDKCKDNKQTMKTKGLKKNEKRNLFEYRITFHPVARSLVNREYSCFFLISQTDHLR